MSRGAREVCSTITTGSNDGLKSLHSMNSSISHIVAHNTSALTIFHDQIESKVLNEENAIVTKGSSEQGMQHTVASSICDGTASVCLSTFAIILGLTTECSLID